MAGVIYCVYNEMYGENVYKLGKTSTFQKRLNSYSTYYITPIELKYHRNVHNITLAETLLFDKLQLFQIKME